MLPRQPQHWFIVLATIFGVFFVFVTPPFHVPDELSHMTRAYGIADGHMLDMNVGGKAGSYIPYSLVTVTHVTYPNFHFKEIGQLQSVPLRTNEYIFFEHPNMSLYSPLLYAPQATAFAISHAANLPAVDAFYLARLMNLAAYIALGWLAIRLLPFGKWAGLVFCLLPMNILLAGSLSADPITIGLVAVTIAAFLRLRSLPNQITRNQYIVLLALAAAVSLTKLPFPILLSLFLFIPQNIFGSTRKIWVLKLVGIAAIALLVGGVWLLIARQTLVSYGPSGVDTALQLQNMFQHPLHFVHALFTTLFLPPNSDLYMSQYVISIGYVETSIPLWLTYAYSIFVALTVFPLRTASRATLVRWQKYLVAGIGATCVFAICVLLYLSWTPVGGSVVDGIQARYLTPFLMLLIPLMAVRSKTANEKDGTFRWQAYVIGSGAFLLASLLMSIYFFYIKH